MFTGIIEELGTVEALDRHKSGARLLIGCCACAVRSDAGREHRGEWRVSDGGRYSRGWIFGRSLAGDARPQQSGRSRSQATG